MDDFRKSWLVVSNRFKLIRMMFFILDKVNTSLFLDYFCEIRDMTPDSFYYNISHMVGKPNSRTFENSIVIQHARDDYDTLNSILDTFVQKEYQETFRNNWVMSSKRELNEKSPLPRFTEWKTLIELCRRCPDTKTKLIVITLLRNQTLLDKKNGVHSETYELLKSTFPDYVDISPWESENFIIDVDYIPDIKDRYMHIF